MRTVQQTSTSGVIHVRAAVGLALIAAGGLLFLDSYLKTGWLSLVILPAVGLFLYLWGIRLRHAGMILAGALLGGFGAGCIAAWGPAVQMGAPISVTSGNVVELLLSQMGILSLFTGIGWGVFVMTTTAVTQKHNWWGLIPGGVLGSLGACLLFTELRWGDFVLYLSLGTGLPLLFWGLVSRLFGLIIPGCLLITMGPGVYVAWQAGRLENALVQTGIMLMWFAAGWALISISGRAIFRKSMWWPLIPGSIIAVAGMGMYIGGDPTNALGFIGNTGSIALMIFGLYLLLMRKGIHH
jgi:hypothetical protein